MAFLYPWGNTQQLNLDWILQKIKELEAGSGGGGGGGGADLDEVANALISATYSPSQTYERSDIVYYDGKLYRANQAIPAPGEAWTPAHWDEILLGDTVSNLVQYVAALSNDQIVNNSNVSGAHTSDALDNLNGAITDTQKSKVFYNRLGHNIVFFGDSWTEGYSASDNSKRFTTLLANELGCTEFNFGLSGAGFIRTGNLISSQITTATSNMTSEQKANTNIVFLFGGLNDFRHMKASKTAADFAIAVKNAVIQSHTAFPNALIVLALSNSMDTGLMETDKVWVYAAYDEIETSLQFPILLLKNTYNLLNGRNDTYYTGGLHPNDYGHSLLSGYFANAIMGGSQEIKYNIGDLSFESGYSIYEGTGKLIRINDEILLYAAVIAFPGQITSNTLIATLPYSNAAPALNHFFPTFRSNRLNGFFAVVSNGNVRYIPEGTGNNQSCFISNAKWLKARREDNAYT